MILRRHIRGASEWLAERLMDFGDAVAHPGRDVKLPPVLIIALPKSGSVYLQRAVRRSLRVPIRHIGQAGMSGITFQHAALSRFERGNVVSREHFQPRPFALNVLARHGVTKVVLHVRDPRGAIVSWTRHMDRNLERLGLRSLDISCELPIPDAYERWSFAQRLHWQVENKMPSFVRWIEDWLFLAAESQDVQFLVTDYEALRKNSRDLIGRILTFNGIDYRPDWIHLPSTEYGKSNIYSAIETDTVAQPHWARQMPPETLAAANALMPPALIARFGWPAA